ncbi:MAG: hypothetical protein WC959_05360 [Kiritimatiellales bacterium]
MKKLSFEHGDGFRRVMSEDYNTIYDFKSGYFARWGKTLSDNNTPPYPEVLDMEVTTICRGVNGRLCPYCYKANTPNGRNMSFATFKKVFDKLPMTITQIAFSADADLTANPEVFDMMRYCRTNGHHYVVPSISVGQVTENTAWNLLNARAGCVGVSRYDDKEPAYDAVETLSDLDGKLGHRWQINLHIVISEDTFEQAMETIEDTLTDPRLKGLNSIVFLSLKQKGRGCSSKIISPEHFRTLIETSQRILPQFGLDVCATPKLLRVKDTPMWRMCSQPCDSGIYGSYINVDGCAFPCSFMEGTSGWETGVDVISAEDYMRDVWRTPAFINHRKKIADMHAEGCRLCPVWDV